MDENRVMEGFRGAYRDRDDMPIPDAWRADAMRRIRRIGPFHAEARFFNRFVWRFAGAACMIALGLSLYVATGDFTAETELARIYFEDPVGFGLLQTFDML
jgi:hypothetical protein